MGFSLGWMKMDFMQCHAAEEIILRKREGLRNTA